ncbi:MAG TPA: DUF4870 domain-containing protein [Pyrinomonadaceae bacterium]|jgi:uncharacterized membrane protein|nr:DUF4870 domain-containing protein [Pyrinomonadaceae bacterium]
MQNPPPSSQPPASSGIGGLDPKVAAALSYIWIVGLIFYFMEKENRFVRFHAMQSIIFGITNSVILIALMILSFVLTIVMGVGGAMVGGALGLIVSLLGWLIWLLFALVMMALFAGLVFAAYKAYQGEKFKLPFIGNMAEKIVDK